MMQSVNSTNFNFDDDKPQTPYWEFKESFKQSYFEYCKTTKRQGMEFMFRLFDKSIIKIIKNENNDLINEDIAVMVNNWLELDKKDIAIILPGLDTFYKEINGSKKWYIPLVYITREDYYDEAYRKSHWNMPKGTKFGEVCLDQTLSEVVLDVIEQVRMLLRNRNEELKSLKSIEKTPNLENCDYESEEPKNIKKRR